MCAWTLLLVAESALAASTDHSGGFRGPHRNGHFPAAGLLREWPEGGPTKLWVASGIGIGYSTPCVTSNRVYLTGIPGGKKGRAEPALLSCFDTDGRLIWRRAFGMEKRRGFAGPRSTPLVADGLVFAATSLADLACFDEISAFRPSLGARHLYSHPVIWNGRLYLRHGDTMACYEITEDSRREQAGRPE